MKKIILSLFILVFAATFTSCGSTGKMVKKKSERKDIELVPEHSNLIVQVNIADFLKVKKLKELVDKEMNSNMPKDTVIDLNNLKHITLFSKIENPKDLKNNPNFGFILKADKLTEELVKKTLKSSEELKHGDNKILVVEKIAGVSLIKNILVGGDLENAKKILDLVKETGKSVNKEVFVKTFKDLDSSSARLVMLVSAVLKAEMIKAATKMPLPIAGLNVVVEKLEVIALGSSVSDTHIELKLMLKTDKDAAVALASGLTGLINMVGLKVDEIEKEAKGSKEAFESIKFEGKGNYFIASIKLPLVLFDSIK